MENTCVKRTIGGSFQKPPNDPTVTIEWTSRNPMVAKPRHTTDWRNKSSRYRRATRGAARYPTTQRGRTSSAYCTWKANPAPTASFSPMTARLK